MRLTRVGFQAEIWLSGGERVAAIRPLSVRRLTGGLRPSLCPAVVVRRRRRDSAPTELTPWRRGSMNASGQGAAEFRDNVVVNSLSTGKAASARHMLPGRDVVFSAVIACPLTSGASQRKPRRYDMERTSW
ncbi:MAG: hypothetical protein RL701_2869 [Pseudomonadota bacterium]